MTFDLDALLSEFDAVAKSYAEAAGQEHLLSEYRKITKARAMRDAELRGATSATKQEREALLSDAYIEAVRAEAGAIQECATFKLRLEAIRSKIDAWRTLESSARYERQNYMIGARK